jgi:hypothetical protein
LSSTDKFRFPSARVTDITLATTLFFRVFVNKVIKASSALAFQFVN